jgi:hypothetical protein
MDADMVRSHGIPMVVEMVSEDRVDVVPGSCVQSLDGAPDLQFSVLPAQFGVIVYCCWFKKKYIHVSPVLCGC